MKITLSSTHDSIRNSTSQYAQNFIITAFSQNRPVPCNLCFLKYVLVNFLGRRLENIPTKVPVKVPICLRPPKAKNGGGLGLIDHTAAVNVKWCHLTNTKLPVTFLAKGILKISGNFRAKCDKRFQICIILIKLLKFLPMTGMTTGLSSHTEFQSMKRFPAIWIPTRIALC